MLNHETLCENSANSCSLRLNKKSKALLRQGFGNLLYEALAKYKQAKSGACFCQL